MSMLPCARAARHQTFEKILRTLVQDPVLLRSLRLLCEPCPLTSPEMQAPRLQIRRHPSTASHVSRLCVRDDDVVVLRAKHTGSFPPTLPKHPNVREFVARRRKYGEDTP
ncbi:hypothetical protein MRX96_000399 [Rhipicephalus microplus]